MIAKEFFREVWGAEREIKNIQSRKEHYMEVATSLGGMSTSTIRTNDKRSRVEMAVLEMVSIADGLGEEAERYAELIRLAEHVLGRMQGAKYRELLSRRYILHESWAEISTKMGYTDEKSVFRAHGWALVRAQKVLDEMENGELLPPVKCGIV